MQTASNPLAPSRVSSSVLKRTPLQRSLAALLLFLFVQDIGFHIAESFFLPSEGSTHTAVLGGHGFPDTDGCGIPDHDDGTPFHHHHFPAVVSAPPLPIALIAMARLIEALPVETIRSSSIIPIGRAPPLV